MAILHIVTLQFKQEVAATTQQHVSKLIAYSSCRRARNLHGHSFYKNS